jgi:hypothetical protein
MLILSRLFKSPLPVVRKAVATRRARKDLMRLSIGTFLPGNRSKDGSARMGQKHPISDLEREIKRRVLS